MPEGELAMEPVPVPDVLVVMVNVPGAKVAVTVVLEDNEGVQVEVPLHPPPLHPEKTEPLSAVAVSTTVELVANACEQVEPQLKVPGALVTEPVPLPDLLIVNVTELLIFVTF